MTEVEKLVRDKIRGIENTPVQFMTRAAKVQQSLLEEVLGLMGKLDTKNGEILLTAKNVRLLEQISTKIKSVLSGTEYLGAVKQFSKSLVTQQQITRKLFEKSFGEGDFGAVTDMLMKQSQKTMTLELVGESVSSSVVKPIDTILQSAVSSGATTKETIKSVTEAIMGNKSKLGALESHAGQIVYDSFANADRAYTSLLATEIGADWFMYAGGAIKSSRAFCIDRAGQYFHRKEIEAWGAGDVTEGISRPTETSKNWQGKNTNTNSATIFVYAGGYNCQHAIIPVPVSQVPKRVIERNIASGNISD